MIAVTIKYEKINQTCHLHQGKSCCKLSPCSPSSFWRRPAHFMAHRRCLGECSFLLSLVPIPPSAQPSIHYLQTCQRRSRVGNWESQGGLLLPRQPTWASLALGWGGCVCIASGPLLFRELTLLWISVGSSLPLTTLKMQIFTFQAFFAKAGDATLIILH